MITFIKFTIFLFLAWLFIVGVGQFFNMLFNPVDKRTKFKGLALVALCFAVPFAFVNIMF